MNRDEDFYEKEIERIRHEKKLLKSILGKYQTAGPSLIEINRRGMNELREKQRARESNKDNHLEG